MKKLKPYYHYPFLLDRLLYQIKISSMQNSLINGFPYNMCGMRRKKVVAVSDVGDYSLFIKKDLSNVEDIYIKSRKSGVYIPSEVISSSNGSILYFNIPIRNVFKENCLYPIILYRTMTLDDWNTLEKEFSKKHRWRCDVPKNK